MPKDEIIEFIASCQNRESGGISASIGHDPHILYTLSAVQVYQKTLPSNVKITYYNLKKIITWNN